MTLYIKYKMLRPDVREPLQATAGAAGFDLYCPEDIDYTILPNGVTKVPLGIAFEIPVGYEGQIRMRSSWGAKGYFIPNAPGTIDSDYRGEISILIAHTGNAYFKPAEIKGERLVQLVIAPIAPYCQLYAADNLSDTSRGTGGFGSTG